jgi:hypothetical protein
VSFTPYNSQSFQFSFFRMRIICFTHHASRITHHASRITHHGNCFMHGKFLLLLTFGAIFFFAFARARAQSNAEYTFRQQSTAVGSSYGFPADFEPAPNLTMSCLAANGYGQWTLSSSPGTGGSGEDAGSARYPAGWYLLANGLYTPSTNYESGDPTDYPGCYPPGVVQDSALSFPTEVKATTNLSGMAGFVWPEQIHRRSFVLNGFTAADVDLSLSFLNNPSPVLALGSGNTDIVRHPIHSWPSVSTSTVGPVTHAITSASGDFRDNFDVCSDGYYNYFIWASTDNPLFTGQEEVWVMAVPIGSSTPAIGPTMVDDGINHDGDNPTITCDPRNNRGSGPYSPSFAVAYIQSSVNGINFAIWSGAGWTTSPTALSKTFWNPTASCTSSPWQFPTHKRIVQNSVYGNTSSYGIYAIVNRQVLSHSATGVLLAYYDPAHLGSTANYVAGDLLAPPSPITALSNPPVSDGPIIAFADPYDNQANWHNTDEFHCLYQYDLGLSATPQEFPLCIVRGCDVGTACPDLYSTYSPDPSTQDTRLVLNQSGGSLELDPTGNWYVGAVNQMGIHVHWLAPGGTDPMTPGAETHFYSRDTSRTFDEPIDENTLETDICTVSDGSSTGTNHGGTVGATLQDGLQMTIWTDPNYGANVADLTCSSGLFQPGPYATTLDNHVGQLDFVGNNVILAIGEDAGATLTDMPYFYFKFPYEYAGQGVTINYFSVFDYYGLDAWHNSDGTINALTTPFSDGGIGWEGGGTITLTGVLSEYSGIYYSTLNMHGGSDFTLGSNGQLLSTYGQINVLYDGDIFPMESGNLITGHATLHGYTDIGGNSEVIGNVPSGLPNGDTATIITILGYEEGIAPQFDAESSSFWNNDTNAASIILAKQDLKCYNGVKFNGCSLTAMNFHAITTAPNVGDPTTDEGITFTNDNFYEQHGRTIFIENLLAPTGLDEIYYQLPITIESNHFYTINHTLESAFSPDGNANEEYGIYIKGLDGNWDDGFSDLEGVIKVESNVFTGNNWNSLGYPSTGNFTYAAAICFENTTGNIISNTISDPGYTNGIWLMATIPTALQYDGSPYTAPPAERTFICSNMIRNLHRTDNTTGYPALTGIRTEYHTGYAKLNNIINCEVGYWSAELGNSFLAFDSIDDYYPVFPHDSLISNAIKVTSSTATNFLSLSGIHGSTDGGDDFAANNTVRATYDDGATGMITVDGNSDIEFGNNLETWSWTQFGQNNLYLCTPGNQLPGTSTQPTTTDAFHIVGTGGSATPLGNVDFNFWGIDGSGNPIDPANECTNGAHHWNNALTSQQNASNVTLTCPTHTLSIESNYVKTGLLAVTCGTSFAITHHKDLDHVLGNNDSIPTGCQLSFNRGLSYEANGQYPQSYDTLQAFVQTCATDDDIPSAAAFAIMEDDVQYGGNGPYPSCWPPFEQWLLSAFAWNPGNAQYFCADVHALAGALTTDTENAQTDSTWQQINTGTNKSMSVIYWILHNPLCTNGDDSELYRNGRLSQYETYLDWPGLNHDSVPFDTTVYTMQQLGLDSVLKYAGLLGVSNNTPSIITNASAYPNPTGEGTVISFGIAREAYVSINLYDVLGHQVSSAGFGGVVEPGNLSVPMSLVGLPAGTYFAHIQTTYGEAQTVKLVKE